MDGQQWPLVASVLLIYFLSVLVFDVNVDIFGKHAQDIIKKNPYSLISKDS